MPTDARNIARWLIWFANEHGETMTNLRLQKMLYYAQAWRLALNGERLMDAEFQAWIHGPVIPWLWGEYKQHGSGPIPSDEVRIDDERYGEPALGAGLAQYMREIWEVYGAFTSWQLEQLTHAELPWLEARCGAPDDEPCKNVISDETMGKFYHGLMNGNTAPKS